VVHTVLDIHQGILEIFVEVERFRPWVDRNIVQTAHGAIYVSNELWKPGRPKTYKTKAVVSAEGMRKRAYRASKRAA
jgi:hypothetical protein